MQEAALDTPKDRDLILLSPTGSGKTLAFLLPLLATLKTDIPTVQVLIIVPSRELALQIEQVFKALGSGFKANCFYGGHPVAAEIKNLSQPPALLIGTPGRLAHHLRRKTFDTGTIHTLILDEFDKSLEFGFHEDIAYIMKQLPTLGKRVLTSATQLDDIPAFTGISNPLLLNYLTRLESIPNLTQKVVLTEAADKLDTLFALICKISAEPTLVFCNHRDAVERISDLLWDRGLAHDIFHGGMEQDDRERALLKFRNGSHRILVTTDLASRGLDIPEIKHIIHYQLPHTEDAFLHRNGRTARMHATGTSYLLLAPDEKPAYLAGLTKSPEVETLPENPVIPPPTAWETLYIGAGKKEKINKVDIVGLLLKKGELAKEDLGLIEVLDHSAYAAVKREQIGPVVKRIANEKIKGKKIKIEISR